jgi:hypothetical protein
MSYKENILHQEMYKIARAIDDKKESDKQKEKHK